MSAEGTGLEPDPVVEPGSQVSAGWSTPVSVNPPAADPRDKIRYFNRRY
jgi:hypothetical protein